MTKRAARQAVDWELYRHFLAVAKTGNLTAAAKQLGVSQPTVGRQIQALEGVLSARLFDRTSNGHVLTSAGEAIVDLAEAIEDNAIAIERKVAGDDTRLSGPICISAAEGIATYWLAPRLPALRRHCPQADIELVVGASAVDLMRREADIALRIGHPGPDDLVGRRIGKVSFGLFASEDYLAEHGTPKDLNDLAAHTIVESVGAIADLAQARELRHLAQGSAIGLRCNNLVTQREVVRAGMGIMAIPLYMASAVPELRRVLAEDFDVSLDLWLLTHRDLRRSARVSKVCDFLIGEVRKDRKRLAG